MRLPIGVGVGCISLFVLIVQARGTYAACAEHANPMADESAAAVPGEVLVTFRPDVPPTRARAITTELGATIVRTMFGGRIQHVRAPEGASVKALVDEYLSRPEVEAAEPNHIIRAR